MPEAMSVVRKAFDGLDPRRLTLRRLLSLHQRATLLIRLFRGDEVDPAQILMQEVGAST